jgi:hypothetical protein
MSDHPSRLRALAGLAVVTVVTTLALASCSSNSDSNDSNSGVGEAGSAGDFAGAPEDAAQRDNSKDVADASATNSSSAGLADLPLNTAVIKTASIEMESDDVTKVVDRIYGLATSTRGAVTSESTSTDDDGVASHSRLEVKVPVATFGHAVDEIESFGSAADTETSSDDVTGEVADVNSRVKSAQQSIDQLRRLFARATDLGDIITLERELSRREADLEALQAQQRSLAAQTTMSTILVSVTLVDEGAPAKDDDQAGFVTGIKQGWDGFVTFVVGASHAVGLILPLGTLALILGWLGWIAVRRFAPHQSGRGGSQPQPSTPSTE